MSATMIDPNVLPLHPQPLPKTLGLLDGGTASGDLTEDIGVRAGWLKLIYAAPVEIGFNRMSSVWVPQGDGTALEVVSDVSQADLDAANAAAQEAQQAQQQANELAQAQANKEAQQAAQAAFAAAVTPLIPHAQRYRQLLRQYAGEAAEVNHAVTQSSVFGYFARLGAAGQITVQELADASTMQMLFSILNVVAHDAGTPEANTWSLAFWALIPLPENA